MAAPTYMSELTYTFVQPPFVPIDNYQVETPETRLERSFQTSLAEANAHLRNEEYRLALSAFGRLQAEILRVADPELPVVESDHPGFVLPAAATMVEPLLGVSATMLGATAEPTTTLPPSIQPTAPVFTPCLLYTSPSPRDKRQYRMPSSA